MVKRLLLLYALVMIAFMAKAQVPVACGSNTDPPAEDCESSCIYCNFNGMTANTGDYAPSPVPSFCQSIQNDMWLGFIAGAPGATFTITPSNCSDGNGVQVALYGGCGEPFIACNGGNPGGGNNAVSITASLTVGTNYYLLIDGYSADACDVSISVVPAAAVQAPAAGVPTSITGPATVCPGSTASYTAGPANLTGVGFYEWTGPPGSLINGLPSPAIIDAPGGRTVQITFPSTSVPLLNQQICVKTSNTCFDGGIKCRTVNIVPIAKTIRPPKVICNEDSPYTLVWGDDVNVSGTYQHTYTSYQGCDSLVEEKVTILAPITKNIGPKYVCQGGSITVCGTIFDTGGQFSEKCTSYLGCDSTVFGFLTVLAPIADILGGGTLSCATSSILLTAAPTPGNTLWRNKATGALVSSTNTYNVTAAGTYILTSSMTQAGVTCSKADTITIMGNTTPPTAVATAAGVLGCTTTSVTLNGTSNATGATFSWVGPTPFTATGPSVTALVAGTYTVTAVNPANGCSATATASVTGNTTPPTASATGGIVTCATTSIALGASSNVAAATYMWTGPGTFTPGPNVANPSVSTSGTYTVKVTDPGSGCTSTATATITSNTTPPGGTASVSSPIGCTAQTVTLTATTAAASPSFTWAGPITVAPGQTASVGTAGTYTVTIVSGANGCSSTATVNVTGDTNLPNVSTNAGTLSCGQQSLALNGASTTPNVTYAWTGPNGFTANTAATTATVVGTYTLTVTATNNCTSTQTAIVNGDFTPPEATATGGIITCASSNTGIGGSSTTPGATFMWTGPGGYTSPQANNNVSSTGVYTLEVTAPNGCTATATATVAPDANVPNAAAIGGTLNCLIDSLTLNGSSTTPGVTLTWSGPNGFTSPLANPMIGQSGTYTLTVANAANGCSAQATANVVLDDVQPGATATGGTLTCASPNFILQGNSATTGVTWLWSGPNAFTSTAQNPSIGVDGAYTLEVTDPLNGCKSTATATVQADQNAPQAAATTAETLTCSVLNATLNGTSTQPGTFAWTGPGTFTSPLPNPSVSVPGLYTLTVKSANGCTDVASVTVNQDILAPDLVGTSDTISCNFPQGNIAVVTTAPNPSYQWTGPGGFVATVANPTVPASGNYLVTITGGNGCKSLGTINVADDTQAPTASATAPTTLTCAVTSVGILATAMNAASAIQSFDWTGPNGYVSTVEDPTDAVAPGIYTLLVTSVNGCTSTTQATVLQNIAPPNVSTTTGTVTCLAPTLALDGGSTSIGSLFDWTGPNGFTAATEDISVTDPGPYILTVTGTNGCTSSQTATVLEDKVLPGAAAVSTNNLDCDDLQTTLQGTSPTTNVNYKWTGPNGFTSILQNAPATMPGTYTVTTVATNGCTSTATVDISQDISAPGASATGDTINCISGQAPLTATSPTNNVTWKWSGPGGFTSTVQNPIVTVSGAYSVTVTGANACTSAASAQIALNTNAPQVSISGGGILTCAVTDLTLTGTIATPNATGVWSTGETTPTITVATPGTYTFTVTAVNGCKSAPSSTISQNIQVPLAVTASNGQVDCNTPTIAIAGNSSTAGVTYQWTGPGGYTSTSKSPNNITNPGDYILIVTNPVNGCTETATSTVTQDPTVPDILVTTDTITCKQPQVTLDAASGTPNVTYKWTGPGGFTSTIEDPTTTVPGAYSVIAKATSGCTATFSIMVEQNKVPPTASASGDTITCFSTTGTLAGNSTTGGVTYLWTGPNFTSQQQNPTVMLTGLYTLVVTAQNGCTASTTATVAPDSNAPQLSVIGGTVTCAIPGITLNATSNVPVTWLWNGPGGFTSTLEDPAATTPGDYTVRATAANGCSVTTGTTVLADTNGPTVNTATPNELNCTTTEVSLGATVPTPGSYTFNWTTQTGNIVSGTNTPAPTVSLAGAYNVVVTNLLNGCSTTAAVSVIVDPATPSYLRRKVRDVSCFGDTNGNILADSVAGGTPPFLFSIDNQPFTASPNFSALPPGVHTLVVQDANGCELVTTDTISEPEQLIVNLGPDTTLHLGNTLLLSLDDIVNDPGRVVQRIVKPADLVVGDTLKPTYSFRYTVTVVDANGCKASDERIVIVNKKRYIYIPNVFYPESTNGNNLLQIYGGEDVERILSFQIFDRWGESVHEAFNFGPNDVSSAWDGRVRGNKMPSTVYVFYAKVLFKDGETEIFKGDVTLFR